MAEMISQVVFKPNPGADMAKLMELVAESAAIWRKHGAEVSIWAVSAGEVGNMVFATRYASYEDLAEIVRRRFERPADTLRELFQRLVFNVLCGNTDDHARNHAAFWDGERLSLTPAYDICPQPRIGNEASHAMLIHGNQRLSNLANCRAACTQFLLAPEEADRLIEQQIQVIHAHWADVCEEAELDRKSVV